MNENTSYKKVDDAVVQSFESAWAEGHPVAIEEAIQPTDPSLRLATLEELVHIDMEFHWKQDSSENLRIETYLERFAELKQPEVIAALARHEYRLRTEQEETLSPTEYEDRFAGLTGLPGKEDTVAKGQAPDTAQKMPTMMRLPGDPPRDPATGDKEPPTMMKGTDTVDAEKEPTLPDQQDTDGENQTGIEGIPGYQLLGELGRGGMGVVYKARDQKLKRLVAIKMILAGTHAGEEEMQRFQGEAEAVAKLNHSNIVNIFEVGEHQGKPYIALEYVEGGSLEVRIGGKPQSAQFSASLLETLARAMHVAHQEEIIHRDLKPANILLDERGEPRITDFGLAKRLDDDSNQTQMGAMMGTPSYMSPEQAESHPETIGPAADTYALGAVLYHLLTGRPPFQAATQLDTIMQVLNSEPVPPRKLVPEVPIDLETICLKCLQKDPRRRYASALELAEDLRRHQADEPISARPVSTLERGLKWARRRPAVAGMLSISLLSALAIVAGGFWYNGQLVKERDTAQQQRKAAEEQKTAAERNFKLARDAVDELTTVSENQLFNLPRMEPVRRTLLEKAKAFYETLLEQETNDVLIAFELGKAQRRLGKLLQSLGDPLAAKSKYEKSIEIFTQLVENHPDLPLYTSQLGVSYQKLATSLHASGQIEQAIELHHKAIKVFEKLTKDNPRIVGYALELNVSNHNLAEAFLYRGQTEQAIKLNHKVIRIWKQLVNDYPDVPDYEWELAKAHNNLAAALQVIGQTEQAIEMFRKANGILEKLTKNHPKITQYVSNLANNYHNLAFALQPSGKTEETIKLYRKAIVLQEQLVKNHPDVPTYASELNRSSLKLGNVFLTTGQTEQAIELYHKFIAIQEQLVRNHPDMPNYAWELTSAFNNLAMAHTTQGQTNQAIELYHEAIKIGEQLVKNHPSVPTYAINLAKAYNNLAVRVIGQTEQAINLYHKSIRIWEQLAKNHPNVPEYPCEKARTYNNLAIAHLRSGQTDRGVEMYHKAISIQNPLIKDHPGVPKYATIVGEQVPRIILFQGQMQLNDNDHTKAAESGNQLANLKVPGNQPTARLANLYNGACLLSLASAVAAKDEDLAEDRRKKLKEQYAARAMQLLIEAKSGGWFDDPANITHLKETDTDLDPLRQRDDFKKFVETLKTD